MKSESIRKISVLGLVLMAASAVTAAILPDKSSNLRSPNGSLRQALETGDGNTCKPDVDSDITCTASITGTTLNPDTTRDEDLKQTQGNTSADADEPNDVSSVVA